MPRLSGALLALAALASPALAGTRQLSARTHAPAARQASSANVVTPHVLSLRKTKTSASRSKAYLASLRSGVTSSSSSSNASYGAEPVDNLQSDEYVAEIEWDGVPVEVIIDTGSSDTWLVQAGFTCVDEDGNEQSVCHGHLAPPPPPQHIPSLQGLSGSTRPIGGAEGLTHSLPHSIGSGLLLRPDLQRHL